MSSAITVWTFSSSTFTRILSNDSEFEVWFDIDQIYTKDAVLGSTQASDNYLDIGGVEVGPLNLRAQFGSEVDRDVMVGLRGDTATLSNTRGRTGSATLVKAKRIDSGMDDMFFCDLTFELRG